MKIALVNYRYFISGGPERYFFNIKEVLERHGHDVSAFSVKSSKNLHSDFERYFLESVDDEEYFSNTKKTPSTILKSFSRMFYSFEAKRKFRKFLADAKPDIVYIMQYHNKISPSIIDAARKLRIPVIHRISDFQYMCPNALFYNEKIGVCEDCLKGKRMSCVKYRCVHNSLVLSSIKAMAKALHDMMGVKNRINRFIVPSKFTLEKLKEYGIQEEKLVNIPTFFNLKEEPTPTYEPYFLYLGRIEKQKGISTLIKAFKGTEHKLKLIGFSNGSYMDELKSELSPCDTNIEFLGRMDFDAIKPYLNSCLCTIVPSEWYDNFPNSILESFAFKKPVIATDFGSLPELVKDGVTGLTFKYKNVADLRNRIEEMAGAPALAKQLGQNAYDALITKYSPESHYSQLIEVFNSELNA